MTFLRFLVTWEAIEHAGPGFIGQGDLNVSGGLLPLGELPTAFQAMLLGAGFPQEVEIWSIGLTGAKMRGLRLVNPGRVRVWREGHDCVWKQNGVWDVEPDGTPRLLRPDHFL